MFLGRWEIDDLLTFTVNTHTPSTGAGTDADAVPAYRVYEDETGTAILTGNMAKLDDANTVGFYSEQITLSAANGFEVGKSYTVYVAAVVGGVTGTLSHGFQVEAALATAANLALVKADTAAILDDTGTAGVVVAASSKTGYSLSTAGIQAIWDALTSGLVTAGSIGKYILDNLTAGGISGLAAAVWAYATRTLTANINGVTIVSAVNGNAITVYEYATWAFTLTDSALALTDYENLIFVVKNKAHNLDNEAVLLVDITTGLIRIGGAAPTAANLGSVVKDSATSFTVLVAMSEVATKIASARAGGYTWQLKGIDTGDDPDQGFVLIEGTFTIKGGRARAII